MKRPIYLDNHATTPCDPRVVEKMVPFFNEEFGNANSRTHSYGTRAGQAVEEARGEVAKLLGASTQEICFTSGATESINIGIVGIARAYKEKGNHLITAATEHKAVLYAHKALQTEGFQVTVLPVDSTGMVDPDDVKKAITDRTTLVSIMAANNEIGTIHPIEEISRICHEREVLFNSDAVQAAGKMPFDVEKVQADLVPLSAHKIYGPKGIGVLYLRKRDRRVRFQPTVHGGGQEKGLRSGTLNVPGIVGLGEAARILNESLNKEISHLNTLRSKMVEVLSKEVDGVRFNGHPKQRIPNNVSVTFPGVDGTFLMNLIKDDVAVSSGATCVSVTIEPSHVLSAIGLSPDDAHSTIRMGIGRFNTEADISNACDVIAGAISQMKSNRNQKILEA